MAKTLILELAAFPLLLPLLLESISMLDFTKSEILTAQGGPDHLFAAATPHILAFASPQRRSPQSDK